MPPELDLAAALRRAVEDEKDPALREWITELIAGDQHPITQAKPETPKPQTRRKQRADPEVDPFYSK